MSARFWAHVREGAPWAVGVLLVGTYHLDEWHNNGEALKALQESMRSSTRSAQRTAHDALTPVLQMLDEREGSSLRHTPDEQFMNMETEEQVARLERWLRTGDHLRACHFLRVLSVERGSPATDWPTSPKLHCPSLLEEIDKAYKKEVLSPELYLAAVSVLVTEPGNARVMCTDANVGTIVQALQKARESETSTVLGLRALCMVSIHEEKVGLAEQIMIRQNAVPYLLSVLNDCPANLFEVRFPAQLLSACMRWDPSVYEDAMTGRYRDVEGNKLKMSTVVVRGLQTADQRHKIPHYLRLARDMVTCGGDSAVEELREDGVTGVLLGVGAKNTRYSEIMPTVARLLRMVTESHPQPHQVLLHENGLLLLCGMVERAGNVSHRLVRDIQATVDAALADPRALVVMDKKCRAQLERFRASCEQQLGGSELPTMAKDNKTADIARLQLLSVSNFA